MASSFGKIQNSIGPRHKLLVTSGPHMEASADVVGHGTYLR